MASILDGKKLAQIRKAEIKDQISLYTQKKLRRPKLAVILVGDDKPSQIYVSHKEKACAEVGIESITLKIPADIFEADLLKLVRDLNNDPSVDGILPQLPLPSHINKMKVIAEISFHKDVDGLGFENQGRLAWNEIGIFPCTPSGVMDLFRYNNIELAGKNAVIVGRSVLVGAPMATLLCHAGATVTMLQKKSLGPEKFAKEADILISATGVQHLITRHWIKQNAIVVDVGIHRDESGKITGDVHFDQVAPLCSWITPVPGGVGPMTIVHLLKNCVKAYELHNSII